MTSMLLHADGVDVPHTILSGHFDVSDGKLDIGLELEIGDDDNDESPREIMIRFANINFHTEDNCLYIRDHHDEWGADDGAPHAYVYTGFHHTDVSAWIEVESHVRSVSPSRGDWASLGCGGE